MPVSRHTWFLPRWARTALGVDETTNVTEPPSQQKDSGWDPSDTPVLDWWNWMWRETHKGLLYLVEFVEGLVTTDTLTWKGKSADFGRTDGSGQVTIATGVVVIDGVRYVVPQTIIAVPVQTAQAVMHRFIAARLSGGVPVLAMYNGASTGVDPAVPDGDAPLWRLRQDTGSATWASDDIREWGAIEIGRVMTQHLQIADRTGLDVFRYDWRDDKIRTGYAVWQLSLPVDSAGASVSQRNLRKTIHPGFGMLVIAGAPVRTVEGLRFASSSDDAFCAIHEFPPHAVIRYFAIRYTVPDATNALTAILRCHSRLDGSIVWTETLTVANASAGTRALKSPVIDELVSEDHMLIIELTAGANHDITVHSVTVEYACDYPFEAWPTLP